MSLTIYQDIFQPCWRFLMTHWNFFPTVFVATSWIHIKWDSGGFPSSVAITVAGNYPKQPTLLESAPNRIKSIALTQHETQTEPEERSSFITSVLIPTIYSGDWVVIKGHSAPTGWKPFQLESKSKNNSLKCRLRVIQFLKYHYGFLNGTIIFITIIIYVKLKHKNHQI